MTEAIFVGVMSTLIAAIITQVAKYRPAIILWPLMICWLLLVNLFLASIPISIHVAFFFLDISDFWFYLVISILLAASMFLSWSGDILPSTVIIWILVTIGTYAFDMRESYSAI